jgi:hypothetical protein
MVDVLYRKHAEDCALMEGYDCTCSPEVELVDEVEDLQRALQDSREYIERLEAVANAARKANMIRSKVGGDHNLFWTEGWRLVELALSELEEP